MFGGLGGPAFILKCISIPYNVINVLFFVPMMLPEQ